MIDVDGVKMHEDLKAQLTDASKLKAHPDNPRRGNVDAISASIAENGVYKPIVAQRSTGYIIAGRHAYEAMTGQGARKVPVLWVDVDDDRAKRIMLADNRTSELGTFDEAALMDLLNDLDGAGTLDGTGYTSYDLDDLANTLASLTPPAARLDLVGDDDEDGYGEDVVDRVQRQKFTDDGSKINANRRMIILDLPVDRFLWLSDRLKLVCDTEGLETNQDAVLHLAESYVPA